jgi:hypothetical protein
LEKKEIVAGTVGNNNTSNSSNDDIQILKQGFQTVKQSVIQTKGICATIVKENKELKAEINNFKQELSETKDLLKTIQHLTMENNQKLLLLSMVDVNANLSDNTLTEYTDDLLESSENNKIVLEDMEQDQNEIVGTNLKELIENEINGSQ